MSSRYDELLGWLHSMAEKPRGEVEAAATRKNRELLRALCRTALQTNELPARLSAGECADWVVRLRENERRWNQHLGATIVSAEEAAIGGHQGEAAELLAEFAHGCPWLGLKEVAPALPATR